MDPDLTLRATLLGALLVVPAAYLRSTWRREKVLRAGAGAPPRITEQWIREKMLVQLPEVVGTLSGSVLRDLIPALIPAGLGVAVGGYAVLLAAVPWQTRLAATLLTLANVKAILVSAQVDGDVGRIALRNGLIHARAHFLAELRKPLPDLRDSWFAYLVALGLGPDLERWRERHQGPHGYRDAAHDEQLFSHRPLGWVDACKRLVSNPMS
jgi:hypothetical protein